MSKYLIECVDHLSGLKGYPWIHILNNLNEEDFGKYYFEGGTRLKLIKLENRIRKFDSTYHLPELLFGNYFEAPKSKKEFISTKQKVKLVNVWFIFFGIIILFIVPIWLKYNFFDYFIFLALFYGASLLIQPIGKYRVSYLQKFIRYIYKKSISFLK